MSAKLRCKPMAPDRYHHIVSWLSDIHVFFPNIEIAVPAAGVIVFGSLAAIVQAATPAADISWVEHLTLEGALVVAVVFLWKALGAKDVQIAAKDVQLIENAKAMTSALVASTSSNAELRKIIEHLSESLNEARR